MDRSFAGRPGIGGFTDRPARPSPTTRRRATHGTARGAGRARRSRSATRVATPLDRLLAALWRMPAALATAIGACWSYLRARRRLRVVVLLALVLTPLLAGGWLWLRHSSLVA